MLLRFTTTNKQTTFLYFGRHLFLFQWIVMKAIPLTDSDILLESGHLPIQQPTVLAFQCFALFKEFMSDPLNAFCLFFDGRYNRMKSSNKHISDLRRSINKRAVSSRKPSQQPTPRQRYEACTALTKSNTVRQLSAKQPKMNNYLFDMATFEKILSNPRIAIKKKTTKLLQKNVYEQLLLKKSDKMKLVFWNQDPSLMQKKPIILSADLIVNQDCFWDQGEDNKLYEWRHGKAEKEQFVKEWRALHKAHFVIWVVRNRTSWARVQAAVSGAALPVHALFLLKRKRNYTVDYSSILREIERQRQSAFSSLENRATSLRLSQIFSQDVLTIFQTVKVNTKDVAVYDSYIGKIPILIGRKAKVVLMRIEADPPGLDCVLRCLQKCVKSHIEESGSCWRLDKMNSARRKNLELFLCPAISNFISEYLSSLLVQEQEDSENGPQEDWLYEEEQIDSKISEMKQNLIQTLLSNHGRHFQFEGGLSIYNFVGEMFKRNHKIIFDQLVQSLYLEERNKKQKVQRRPKEPGEVDLRVQYYEMEWI